MRRFKSWIFTLISSSLMCLQAVLAQGLPMAGQSLPGLEAFDEAMGAIMSNNKYPGGTLAVAYQGRMVLNKAYGDAKKGLMSSTPMAINQRMRIASMSKLITAVAALKMAELGKLDLDKPFVETVAYSTNEADYADARVTKITLRQLLQNHAGWTIDRSQDPVFDRAPPCPQRSARWLSSMRLNAEPGQLYSYSNINFCLAQQAIEKATGRTYEAVVKAEIATPAGIKSWEFATLGGKADEPDYIRQADDRTANESINFEAIGGAGAWTSSAADYVRFWTALRGYKGQSLLNSASFAQLHARPHAAASTNTPVYYGLGVLARTLGDGSHNLWHNGSLPGTSSFGVSLASGWSIVAIFNSRVALIARDQAVIETDRLLNLAARKSKPPEGELLP